MIVCPIFCGQRWVPRSCLCQPCSRSAAWAVRFRRCRSARCCRKRGGRQIGDQLEKHFADFGIIRPLSGLRALLGSAQILGGLRTHEAASVDVHCGSHLCRRLTLAHSMPWFGHSVQNRDTARNVWMAMLQVSNRTWRASGAWGFTQHSSTERRYKALL